MASDLTFFFGELRRRNVWQVAVAYVVVGLGIMEGAALIVPALVLPQTLVTAIVVLVLLGFPIALVLAWALEVTPEGVKTTEPVESASGTQSAAWVVVAGLAVAGLGAWWFLGPDGEDGILYALEAMNLNLHGTELVALSACETGLGTLDYSDGVYGLVRAFAIAGARSVLMTLWSVNDAQARDFMLLFYENWLSQPVSDPVAALRETRLHYIGHPEKALRDPKVWAPYVLVETSR